MVLNRLDSAARSGSLFPEPPVLVFRPELERCPRCGAWLKVVKTVERHPCTLDIGPFTAHETVMGCGCARQTRTFRSDELTRLVAPGRTFGHDVMVHAGEAVLRRNLTAEDTVQELARMNVPVSQSEVRELVARFAVSLGIAHAEAAPRLRAHLGRAGGYVLHLDSTCQASSAHLMTGVDELSGFVLLNMMIPSESKADVGAFLRSVRERFGVPAAVSCDMSSGILGAVAETFSAAVPVFICHFHFLRDLGKDLLATPYAVVRDGVRRHGPKAELRRLQRELRDALHLHREELEAVVRATETENPSPSRAHLLPHDVLVGALVTSLLDAEHQAGGYGFPFDRPHLTFFRHAVSTLKAACHLLASLRPTPENRKLFMRLIAALEPLCSDPEINRAAEELAIRATQFDRLRTALRIAEPDARQGLNDDGAEVPVNKLRDQVDTVCQAIRADSALNHLEEFRSMLDQIDRHRDRLFADPILLQTPDGPRTVQPQRTNNIMERFFRDLGRQVRKRTGQQPGEAYLNRLNPDSPLVANLDNPRYLDLLLDGAADLAERLARVDQDLVNSTLDKLRVPNSGVSRPLRIRLRRDEAPVRLALLFLRAVA